MTDGLKPGDKVIVDGMAIVGMTQAKKVQTQPWKDPQQQAPAAAPASAPAAAAASEPKATAASQPAAK